MYSSSLFLFIFHLTSSLLIFSFLSPLFSSTHSLSYHYKNSLGERQTAFKYTVKAADQAISRGAFALGWAMCHQALPMAQARTEIGEVLREREWERERERERETDSVRERERKREREREKLWERERERDTQWEKQWEKQWETGRERDVEREWETGGESERKSGRERERERERERKKERERERERWREREREIKRERERGKERERKREKDRDEEREGLSSYDLSVSLAYFDFIWFLYFIIFPSIICLLLIFFLHL